MKSLKCLIPLLVMMVSMAHADTYQKADASFMTLNSITDYTFAGFGAHFEVGQKKSWGTIGAEFRLSYAM